MAQLSGRSMREAIVFECVGGGLDDGASSAAARYRVGDLGHSQRRVAAHQGPHCAPAHFAVAASVGLRWVAQAGLSLRRVSTTLSQAAVLLPLSRMSNASAVRNSSTSTPCGPGW